MASSNSMHTGALLLALAGGVGRPALAQSAQPSAVDSEMKTMDTNGDGKLSAAEHAAGARRMFETMDANKDGRVTTAEMDAAHERVTGRKAVAGDMTSAEKIKVIDTDGDGALTAEEHRAGSQAMFERMDTDRDGFLSKDELAAGHAKMLSKRGE